MIHGAFAHSLIGECDPERMEATYLLVFELMHVVWHQAVDEAFPGSGFQVHDSYEAILYPHIDGVATAYFAARRSAPLFPNRGDTLREYVAAALASATEAIQNEKPVFRLDGNVEPLARCAFRHLGDVMELAAQLMGHCDGLAGGTESLAGEPLSEKLRQLGLTGWFKPLQNELRKIYDRRGRWTSSEEFVRLNRALERALWAFGMIPWKLPDGRMWVRVV